MYYLLALFTGPFGNPAWATVVGGAVLQGIAIIWVARLAWNKGGLGMAITWLSIVAFSYTALGVLSLTLVWNPYIVVPFSILFMLQCWLVSLGQVKTLPGLAFVSTFLVQTHIGYVLPVVLCLSAALIGLWRVKSKGETSTGTRPLVLSLILLAVLWFPPLILDPLLHSPSNIQQVWDYFSRAHGHLGLRSSLGLIATEFHPFPSWLGGSAHVTALGGALPDGSYWLLPPVALLIGSWFVSKKSNSKELQRLSELLIVLFVSGVFSISLVTTDAQQWRFYYRILVAECVVVFGVLIILRSVRWMSRHHVTRIYGVVLVVMTLLLTSVFALDVSENKTPLEAPTEVIIRQLELNTPKSEPVILRDGGSDEGGVGLAILDELARVGYSIHVDVGDGWKFGQGRTLSTRRAAEIYYVFEDSQYYSLYSILHGAETMAIDDPLSETDTKILIELQRSVAGELAAHNLERFDQYLGSPLLSFVIPSEPYLSRTSLNQLAGLNELVATSHPFLSVLSFSPQQVPPQLLNQASF
jgi:hypothetical protein